MIKIQNKADEKPTIEILSDIGEDFWTGGGITAQTISDEIKNIQGDFEVVIGSLGGDVHHALMIHDLIRMHPGKVNVKIIGMTASSGTVIAMAGNSIEMSKNSMFLIHNASTGVWGNSKDLTKAAEDLDQVDGRLAGIYSRVTGKRKSQILTLMEKEEWLSAEQAKEYGFINKIFEPATPTMNKAIIEKINNSTLPKIKTLENMDTTKILDAISSLKALFVNNKVDDESAFAAKVAEIDTRFEALKAENDSLMAQKADIQAALDSYSTEKAGLIEAKEKAEADMQTAITEKETIKNEFVEYAKAKLDRPQCVKLGVDDFSFLETTVTPDAERTTKVLSKKQFSIKDADDN